MNSLSPVQALEGLSSTPIQRYAVTRERWLPYIQEAETFLAMDEEEAIEIADTLKEELRELIGDTLCSPTPMGVYQDALVASWETVKITKVALQAIKN